MCWFKRLPLSRWRPVQRIRSKTDQLGGLWQNDQPRWCVTYMRTQWTFEQGISCFKMGRINDWFFYWKRSYIPRVCMTITYPFDCKLQWVLYGCITTVFYNLMWLTNSCIMLILVGISFALLYVPLTTFWVTWGIWSSVASAGYSSSFNMLLVVCLKPWLVIKPAPNGSPVLGCFIHLDDAVSKRVTWLLVNDA